MLPRSNTKYYLVFELASGGELYDHLIDEGKFDEDEAREVAYALVVRLYSFLFHDDTWHCDGYDATIYRTRSNTFMIEILFIGIWNRRISFTEHLRGHKESDMMIVLLVISD